MSHHLKHIDNPKIKARLEKAEHRDRWVEHIFHRALHVFELLIAVITMLGLFAALGIEVYHMFTDAGYFSDVHHLLHNLLTIVVGLEFVRMLIDATPANILEVLTVAITRHVVLSHDDYWSNVACIACIAGLFAIRRFLIRRSALKEALVEVE